MVRQKVSKDYLISSILLIGQKFENNIALRVSIPDFVFLALDISSTSSSDTYTSATESIQINNTMAIACYSGNPFGVVCLCHCSFREFDNPIKIGGVYPEAMGAPVTVMIILYDPTKSSFDIQLVLDGINKVWFFSWGYQNLNLKDSATIYLNAGDPTIFMVNRV